jgi:peptidoglycan/LPS O-acetylase OafA/YrhL
MRKDEYSGGLAADDGTSRTNPQDDGRRGSPTPRFRPEIQGLRALAALLVAVYHVWFGRVSGGVDVFFVVSGFLITGSLIRRYQKTGTISYATYLVRIGRRILPAAYVVLVASVGGLFLAISPVYWREFLADALAAALYVSNWNSAFTAVDYLARDGSQSPFLHFWALSIQGQFYLLWPLALLCVLWLSARFSGPNARRFVASALLGIIGLSLAYSVVATASNQTFHYFNSVARVWEFALGGLLATMLPSLRVPAGVRHAMGWAGLVAIVSTGALFDVGGSFPGYAALLPTLGACLVLVAGDGGQRGAAVRLLQSRPAAWFGDYSYAFFLWHWPLLVFALAHRGVERLTVLDGALVLGLSLVFAVVTTRIVEAPLRARSDRPEGRRFSRTEVAVLGAPPVLLLGVVLVAAPGPTDLDAPLEAEYPGAGALEGIGPGGDSPAFASEQVPIFPEPTSARRDRPRPYDEGCHQGLEDHEPVSCSYGDPSSSTRVVLVGGSHSAHWQPALDEIATARGWHFVHQTKSGCRFRLRDEVESSCDRWNVALLDQLLEDPPDAVVTLATVTTRGGDERLPESYLRIWSHLDEAGIPVIALRDTPRFEHQVPECVVEHDEDLLACGKSRSAAFAAESLDELLVHAPPNVRGIDLTERFCTDTVCPPVIGNVLVYRDRNHITVSYSRSVAPALDTEIARVMPGLYR